MEHEAEILCAQGERDFQISHLVIRDHSYVVGTSSRPEVGVFVQSHVRMKPLNQKKMSSGQTVWMKWNDGPIVAKSKILSWHLGEFHDGNINHIRNMCIGTKLFGLNDYWKTVADKKLGYFAVILLTDEEWLELPIYSNARSYGHSWIYLDNEYKAKQWLKNVPEKELKENSPDGRALPKGMRFDILKRDNFTCKYCGRSAPDVELQVDHIVPWTVVRKHEPDNLTTACKDCNLGKSAKILED